MFEQGMASQLAESFCVDFANPGGVCEGAHEGCGGVFVFADVAGYISILVFGQFAFEIEIGERHLVTRREMPQKLRDGLPVGVSVESSDNQSERVPALLGDVT